MVRLGVLSFIIILVLLFLPSSWFLHMSWMVGFSYCHPSLLTSLLQGYYLVTLLHTDHIYIYIVPPLRLMLQLSIVISVCCFLVWCVIMAFLGRTKQNS